jgi:hypothetical protein
MAEQRIYLKFSDELNTLLRKANVDVEGKLRAELKKEGIDVRTTWAAVPVGGEKNRDVVLLILAAGLTATLVSTAVARLITAVAGAKQAAMKEVHLTPALDGKGKPIRDSNGEPVYQLDEKPGSQTLNQPVSTTKVSLGKILEFELSTGSPGTSRGATNATAPKKKTNKTAKKES